MNFFRIILLAVVGVLAQPYCVRAQSAPLRLERLVTIPNPAPGPDDFFGFSVTALGLDKLIVGSTQDSPPSAAYLFDLNGQLLKTITTPILTNSSHDDYFGARVAAVGTDKILIGAERSDIGASDSGAAYLFDQTGLLLTTFTNPAPSTEDWFGAAISGVDSGKVLIGAPLDDTAGADKGSAYLFDVSGMLLTTFTNPLPSVVDRFGWSVAAVGSDKILIGAWGAVCLFDLSGRLLITFTNATGNPEPSFGQAIAGVGPDKVLIGSRDSDAAFLFDLNGKLLTAFTNPLPEIVTWYAWSVAAVGNDKVLIGALVGPGKAFLFDLSGRLLATIDNPLIFPDPEKEDRFSSAVAGVGTDKVFIGAWGADAGDEEAGAAYLFFLQPTLQITRDNRTMRLSWELPGTNYVVDSTADLLRPMDTVWSQVPFPYQTNTTDISVTVPTANGNNFFRLRKL